MSIEQIYDFTIDPESSGKFFFRRETDGENVFLYKITYTPSGFIKSPYNEEVLADMITEQKQVVASLEDELILIKNL